MTTKYKIISGFLLMMVLLGSVSFLGYRGIQVSAGGFDEYSRLARYALATSDLDSLIHNLASNISKFLDTGDMANMQHARQLLDNGRKKIREAMEMGRRPERVAILREMEGDFTSLQSQMETIQKARADLDSIYRGSAQPQVRKMAQLLLDFTSHTRNMGEFDLVQPISELWFHFSAARSSLTRFSVSRSPQDVAEGRERFAAAAKVLERMEGSLFSEVSRKAFAEFSGLFVSLQKSFEDMAAAGNIMGTASSSLLELVRKQEKQSGTVSAQLSGRMTEQGDAVLRTGAETQRNMFIVSGVGILLGIAVGILLLVSIMKVLRQLCDFATAVARGDFSCRIDTREKGEIGGVVAAMMRIPQVIEDVMREIDAATDRVLGGTFRHRLSVGHLPGSFGELGVAVNSMSDAYTNVLDILPDPLIACNKENSIAFMNREAQRVLGGHFLGEKCSNYTGAKECNTDKCFGACAMRENCETKSETILSIQDKRLYVEVTAIPLRNLHQETVGFIEVITDLTEIRTQQATMQEVARAASDISDRVAASSEQLAAQVEQISRGAAMQRARVESTAAAMEEMNNTVLEVARNAGHASEQSESTREKAEFGSDIVSRMVNSINVVNKISVTLQEDMQGLGKQVENIGGVMNMISDIADQTNLLALNAAIEAARAGDAGRGFAVVADEVRKLAESTMTATKEVETSISAIQKSAQTNIKQVGNAVESINEATELAGASGGALKKIVELASASSSVVSSIATAAEEQSAASEEINRAIDEINTVVGETTEGMVQSSAAVQELAKVAQHLKAMMEKLH